MVYQAKLKEVLAAQEETIENSDEGNNLIIVLSMFSRSDVALVVIKIVVRVVVVV